MFWQQSPFPNSRPTDSGLFNSAATSDVVNLQKWEATFFYDWQNFGYSATAAGTQAMLTGPSSSTTLIVNATQSMQIGLSTGVNLNALIDASGTSFTAVSKHLQGNRYFGVDSDVTATYFKAGTAGTAMVAGDCPASVILTDEMTANGFTAM